MGARRAEKGHAHFAGPVAVFVSFKEEAAMYIRSGSFFFWEGGGRLRNWQGKGCWGFEAFNEYAYLLLPSLNVVFAVLAIFQLLRSSHVHSFIYSFLPLPAPFSIRPDSVGPASPIP